MVCVYLKTCSSKWGFAWFIPYFIYFSEHEHEKKGEDYNTHGHTEADEEEDFPMAPDIHINTSDWKETDPTGPPDPVIADIVDTEQAEHAGPLLVPVSGGGLVDQALAGGGQRIMLKNVEENTWWFAGYGRYFYELGDLQLICLSTTGLLHFH